MRFIIALSICPMATAKSSPKKRPLFWFPLWNFSHGKEEKALNLKTKSI
jgi:hypothetical protein